MAPRSGILEVVAAPTTMTTVTARPEDEVTEPVRRTRRAYGEDDRPRARWERWIGWGIVAVATWLVFNVINPNHDWGIHVATSHGFIPKWPHFTAFRFGDIFRNTTTNGGDMGAHVWWPKFLETNWFPKGRLSG